MSGAGGWGMCPALLGRFGVGLDKAVLHRVATAAIRL